MVGGPQKNDTLLIDPEMQVESNSSSDVAKLHSEVNEYINQKLTILNISITVFGVVMGWVVTGLASVQNGQLATGAALSAPVILQPISVLLPSILLVFLCIMAWYIEAISKQMHILSTYLDVFELSDWEGRYQRLIQPEIENRRISCIGLCKLRGRVTTNRKSAFSESESPLNIQSDMPYIILGILILLTIVVTFGVCALYLKEMPLRTQIALGYFSVVALFSLMFFLGLYVRRDLTSFRKLLNEKWRYIRAMSDQV